MGETDAVLLSRAVCGDKGSFVDIIERYRKAIVGTAFSYFHDHNDVEDVVQDVVISAYTHLSSLRDPDKFGAWVVSITRRACLERIRRTPTLMSLEQVADDFVSFDTGVFLEERLQVQEALSTLGEDKQLTVVLAYVYGYSHIEIAQLLDIPLNTVRSRLRDAKMKLAGCLADIIEVTQRVEPEAVLERDKIMKIIKYKHEDIFWSSIRSDGVSSLTNGADARHVELGGNTFVIACHMWNDVFMREIGMGDPYTIGWFVEAAALSKVAAAGGRPVSSYVSLGLNPWDQESDTVSRLCAGMQEVAKQYQHDAPSFNLGWGTREQDIIIAVTQLGVVDTGRTAQLPGAQPGDLILVTNTLGDSIATVEILKHKLYRSDEEKRRLIKQNIEIIPRVNEALATWRSGLATSVQLAYRGLSTDLQYLSRASGVGARISMQSLPVTDEVKQWAPLLDDLSNDPLFTAGTGNEDYELLITCAKQHVDALIEIVNGEGSSVTVVGEIISEPGVCVEYPDGTVLPEPKWWRHF
ncbi:MAG: sigma-70 family RNA polymerase sigma factor [Armatimonadota bacterium]